MQGIHTNRWRRIRTGCSRCLVCLFSILVMAWGSLPASAAVDITPGQNQSTKDTFRRVLILHSYHQGYLWTDQITEALKDQISPHFKDVEFYIENLDAKRIASEEITQNIFTNLKLKYKKLKIDIIITSDDDALIFMRRFHDELFPKVPVVFCGVNAEDNARGLPPQYYTGLLEVLDVKPNLDLILRLRPRTEKIYVVSDGTTTGLALRSLVEQASKAFPAVRFIYLKGEDLSTDELIQNLKKLDDTSSVFMNVWFRDKNDEFIAYKDINPLMSKNCPAPIFGMIDMLVDLGIVGGKMNSGKIQGREAGAMALRILRGEAKPEAMPIQTQSPNEYMFDHGQLRRFHIDESLLPPGSLVFHRPFSFYQTYKGLVWAVLGVLLLFLILIIALATNQHRLQAAQAQLARSKQDLDITLNSLDEGVIATDIDGRVIRMNSAALRMTGWTLEEALGRPSDEVFPLINSESGAPITSLVEEVMRTGQVTYLDRFSFLIARNQRRYHIADSCSPIRNEYHTIVGAVVVFRDATAEFALQEKLRQSEKLRSVGELAGGIAHDFNNMLMGISGAAEILAHSVNDKHKRLINIIQGAAKQASGLTAQLLVFSRKKQLQMAPVDINHLLGNTVTLLKHTIDKKIRLTLATSATRSYTNGDDAQLQSAFLNLGINASQAMPKGGDLQFCTRNLFLDEAFCEASPFELVPGEHIEIEVRDTGIGIPAENIERVFEPFFTTKEQGKGTGLGLSAVYGTVQSHGGAIQLRSECNVGTVFHIYLPLLDLDAQESLPETEEPWGTGNVLVIEDEEMVRATLKLMLEGLGYQVLTASDGQEGTDIYREKRDVIDLIVLDMIMPRMNGRETFDEILKINPGARILISSGFSRDEDLDAFRARGICDFIRKPYITVELSRAIRKLMAS